MKGNIYLALGDSVTAGYGVTYPRFAFVQQVSDFTKQRSLAERSIVVAKNGWSTKDVWEAANRIDPSIWEHTNVLTVMTGGNDLRKLLRRQYFSASPEAVSPNLVYQRLREFGFYMDRLCSFIAERKIPHVVISTVYNPVPHYPLGARAMEALGGITREIAQQYKLGIVDVHEKFLGNEAYYIEGYRTGRFQDLTSPIRRPIHPNNTGHKEIAGLITAYLTQSTRMKKKGRTTSRKARGSKTLSS